MRFSAMRRRLTAGMLAGLAAALLPWGVAVADEPADHERARRALEAGEVMPLRKVLEQVERDYPGEILEGSGYPAAGAQAGHTAWRIPRPRKHAGR